MLLVSIVRKAISMEKENGLTSTEPCTEQKVMVYPTELSTQSFGRLRVNVTSQSTNRPVSNAVITIAEQGNPNNILEQVTTDAIGRSPVIELPAPPLAYSMEPSAIQPYANYIVTARASEFEEVIINGTKILPDVTAVQPIQMLPRVNRTTAQEFIIGPHTLYGDYPPKIAEAEIKPVNQSGEIVLSRVVIPEYVVVHDGPPRDTSAQNYYVRYRDYIANVASCEIYATWPEATIYANILAIMSFTLNRVYTEWYRNQGYSFTITTSTAYDHKYIPGKNSFENINRLVDNVFANYLSRPNVKQPILTQYCDGRNVQCPNWMTQWGSKYLGDQGYSAIQILRYFYGQSIYINTAEEISGVPSSWPGTELTIGSRGDKVRQMQQQLNRISDDYPLIPKIAADGIYGQRTANAVRIFQEVFNLPATGIVDFATWYKISQIYVGVSRIAELV